MIVLLISTEFDRDPSGGRIVTFTKGPTNVSMSDMRTDRSGWNASQTSCCGVAAENVRTARQ